MPGAVTSFLRRNWFLLGMLAAILLGLLAPEAGRRINPGSATRLALIAALFLIAGLTLPSESIGAGLASWRLHLYVQAFLFLLTPALFFLTSLPLRRLFGPELSAGILALLLRGTGQSLPGEELQAILRDLSLQILLPLAAGQLLRRFLRALAERGRGLLAQLSNALLLGVIFLTMADSAGDPAFLAHLSRAPWPFAYLALMQLLMVALAYGGARLLGFARPDTISACFAAPQKTMALGVPLYHPWQLLIAGFLRNAFLNRRGSPADSRTSGPPGR